MRKFHPNLTAYDNVEQLENFTEESFKRYCDEKLKTVTQNVSFISDNCVDSSWKGKVCEIGSGNSKLLYGLENEGLLTKGIGIEISRSRHKFAEKFRLYMNSRKVRNLNENIFDIPPRKELDLVIGIDIVFQLISPLSNDAEKKLLLWIKKSLRKGGFIILELWDFEHILKLLQISQNKLRLWEEFSKNDPFEFVLASMSLNKEKDIVWEKLFLKRNSKERSKFINILRPYSPEKIKSILELNGFGSVKFYKKWGNESDQAPGEYIVSACKL